MKRVMLHGLALAAMFPLVFASSASAVVLPELLGQEANAAFTGKSTAANPTLETTKGEKIVCKEASEEGVQENASAGTYHVHFTGCESSGFKCNSSGDATGIVLTSGTFHYVWGVSGEELAVAILFLPEEQTIKCTALVTLKIKGSVLCSVLEPETQRTTHEFDCAQSGGTPSETQWWNDEEVEQNALLLTSKNGGSFTESGEQALATFQFSVEVVFGPGVLVFQAREQPLRIVTGNTSEFLVEYKGAGESGLLSVGFEAGKKFTLQKVSTCENGKINVRKGTCTLKIKCEGVLNESGKVSVMSGLPGVATVSKKLLCT